MYIDVYIDRHIHTYTYRYSYIRPSMGTRSPRFTHRKPAPLTSLHPEGPGGRERMGSTLAEENLIWKPIYFT